MIHKISTVSRVAALTFLSSLAADAGITIQFSEVDGNVIAVANGSISSWNGLGGPDTTDLGSNTFVNPHYAAIGMGPQTGTWSAQIYLGYPGQWSAPSGFDSQVDDYYYSTTNTGSFDFLLAYDGFYIDQEYVLGTAFDQVSTWENQTFASLGLTEGTYNWTWTGDTAKVVIGNAIPEPSAVSLAGLALAAVALRRRRSH